MIRRPPRSTPLYSSAASDVYKRQDVHKTAAQGYLSSLLHLIDSLVAEDDQLLQQRLNIQPSTGDDRFGGRELSEDTFHESGGGGNHHVRLMGCMQRRRHPGPTSYYSRIGFRFRPI